MSYRFDSKTLYFLKQAYVSGSAGLRLVVNVSFSPWREKPELLGARGNELVTAMSVAPCLQNGWVLFIHK